VVQCTIYRDKTGLINKFYPIFHLHFSVRLPGRPVPPHPQCPPDARKQVVELRHHSQQD
jgi:hypothetical protein